MRLLNRDGVQLHWREDGDRDGAPLVFVNSLGTDLRLWDDLLPHLGLGWRVIRFDLRGHGLTSERAGPFTLDDLTADAIDLLDRLRLRGATVVGTSLGGMIAQNLAVRRPDLVGALVLTNTAPLMGDPILWRARIEAVRLGGLKAIASGVMERWFGRRFLAKPEVALWRTILIRNDPQGYMACCEAIACTDLSARLSQISQKTLVVGGAQDLACPPDQVRQMARQIAGSTCHILRDVGHLPSVEAPRELAHHITGFLEGARHA